MSAKKMLPIIGVGSAVALIGLFAARRVKGPAAPAPAKRERPSGIRSLAPAVARDRHGADATLTSPVVLNEEFWDPSPESDARASVDGRPAASSRHDAYDSVDTDDLTTEWLARATEARGFDEHGPSSYVDDPAEIAADSLSMISDASRKAAAFGLDDDADPEEESERG